MAMSATQGDKYMIAFQERNSNENGTLMEHAKSFLYLFLGLAGGTGGTVLSLQDYTEIMRALSATAGFLSIIFGMWLAWRHRKKKDSQG